MSNAIFSRLAKSTAISYVVGVVGVSVVVAVGTLADAVQAITSW